MITHLARLGRTVIAVDLRRPHTKRADLRAIYKCGNELWEGLTCTLHKGHTGPHFSPPSLGGCALSWRTATPFPR